MKQVHREIADWIKPYASIVGGTIEVKKGLRDSNPAKFFLQLTIPNIFEKYAIALHSYWINYQIPTEKIKEYKNDDEDLPEEEFTRNKWVDFYKLKNSKFNLNQAILSSVNWDRKFTQMNNELYPGEGLMDKKHLISLSEISQNLYGDEEVEVFYNLLSTTNWDEHKLFEGRVSKIMDLFENKELNFTPSLIYPKNGGWVVNTDYDLSFSSIGGEAKLIEKLVKNNPQEIYELEY